MDRPIVYPGAIPLETDLLYTNQFAMVGLSKIAAALFGTANSVNGLACTPTGPASLQVYVAPGEIYSLQNLDGTAYSSLAADTTHQIVKQGILLDTATLSCPAPGTVGFSINYLIQAAYQDVDSSPVVLPYYNASNPTQAYSGPANSGTAQNTMRKGACIVAAKAGIAASTGSQVTPTADAGYVGLWVVTVAYGQTQIIAGNIVSVSTAPRLNSSMLGQVATLMTTPAQFDNSLKAAPTSFVQRALGNYSAFQQYTSTATLTAANFGQFIDLTAATGFAVTLPLAALSSGGAITILNSSSSAVMTVNRAGADVIYVNAGTVTSFTINPGESATFTSSGGASYFATGSAQLANCFGFLGAQTGSGWQRLPSGLIIQWGAFAGSASADTAIAFPIAFPTAFLQAFVSGQSTGTGAWGSYNTPTLSGMNGNMWAATGTRQSGNASYFAIGK